MVGCPYWLTILTCSQPSELGIRKVSHCPKGQSTSTQGGAVDGGAQAEESGVVGSKNHHCIFET